MTCRSKLPKIAKPTNRLVYSGIKIGQRLLGYFPICSDCIPTNVVRDHGCCVGFMMAISVFGACRLCGTEFPINRALLFLDPAVYVVLVVRDESPSEPIHLCFDCIKRMYNQPNTNTIVVLGVAGVGDFRCVCGVPSCKVTL